VKTTAAQFGVLRLNEEEKGNQDARSFQINEQTKKNQSILVI